MKIKLAGLVIGGAILAFSALSYGRQQQKKLEKPENEARTVVSASEAPMLPLEGIEISGFLDRLKTPWSLEFIDANTALITERGGVLWWVRNGKKAQNPVVGTPKVRARGQGGLLDVVIDPDYSKNGWVYLAFAHEYPAGSKKAMTKIVRGRIKDNHWQDEEVIFAAKPEHYVRGGVHFGGRIAFDDDGHIFFSIGERGKKEMAQDLTRPNGKIHRLMRDGTIPKDNPFINKKDAYGSIYSYGNRNPQGLVYTGGRLWETEHGPRGGDELNLIEKGKNYGWPKASYGRNYSGTELTPYTSLPGMEPPISQWTPSIATCGLAIYQGDMFPEWRGKLLAGALKYQEMRLIDVQDGIYKKEFILLKGRGRVRDITVGPEGTIYVVLNNPDKILKIRKAEPE